MRALLVMVAAVSIAVFGFVGVSNDALGCGDKKKEMGERKVQSEVIVEEKEVKTEPVVEEKAREVQSKQEIFEEPKVDVQEKAGEREVQSESVVEEKKMEEIETPVSEEPERDVQSIEELEDPFKDDE